MIFLYIFLKISQFESLLMLINTFIILLIKIKKTYNSHNSLEKVIIDNVRQYKFLLA